MKLNIPLTLSILTFLIIAPSQAVKIDGPREAENNSTHIVTGKVTAIYSKVTRAEAEETTRCIAQVELDGVEKGDGLAKGQTIYVRYLGAMRWIGKGGQPIGPGPHNNCPAEGDRVKVCRVRNSDGTFDVYYVSGFRKPE
ncbi:MAG: hypothetical protein ABI680_03105 [Chthoniobacteraceae bacterium]